MKISLKDWWQQLEIDIEALNNLSESYPEFERHPLAHPTELMINAGKRIEVLSMSQLISQGSAIESTITNNANIIWRQFSENDAEFSKINNLHDLLFAVIYAEHLHRYAAVTTTVPLGQGRVDAEKPSTARSAECLSASINNYLEAHLDQIHNKFPTTTRLQGKPLLEELLNIIRNLSIEDKVAETLAQKFESLSDKQERARLMCEYSESLAQKLEQLATLKNRTQTAETHTTINEPSLLWWLLSSAASLVTHGASYITPNFIKGFFVIDTPTDLSENLQVQLDKCINDINKTAHLLTPKVLKETPTETLNLIGEKCKLIAETCRITTDLRQFITTQLADRGIRILDFFRPLNEIFSKTFFRRLMNDRLLLLEEARKLKQDIREIRLTAIKDDSQEQDHAEQMKQRLDQTKQTTVSIYTNSWFLFSREKSAAASQSLHRITAAATAA